MNLLSALFSFKIIIGIILVSFAIHGVELAQDMATVEFSSALRDAANPRH